jgi:hypothetical protein
LYQWHVQDPVSAKELNRNNEVYLLQGNRNPFVDSAQWVFQIWNCTGVLTATSVNSTILPSNAAKIYPNPSQATLLCELTNTYNKVSNATLINVNGTRVGNYAIAAGQKILRINTKGISSGQYILKIETPKGLITKKIIITQ